MVLHCLSLTSVVCSHIHAVFMFSFVQFGWLIIVSRTVIFTATNVIHEDIRELQIHNIMVLGGRWCRHDDCVTIHHAGNTLEHSRTELRLD